MLRQQRARGERSEASEGEMKKEREVERSPLFVANSGLAFSHTERASPRRAHSLGRASKAEV